MFHEFINRRHTLSGEKQLSVLATVLLDVLGVDSGEALTDGTSRFIGSKDTLASGGNRARVLNELSSVTQEGGHFF